MEIMPPEIFKQWLDKEPGLASFVDVVIKYW